MLLAQDQKEKWNNRHSQADGIGSPARVLTENFHLLPEQGRALDFACGRGANALCLAEKSVLDVHAWDISNVAIARLQMEADARGVAVHTEIRDVTQEILQPLSFDLILVCHFLERSLAPALMDALRPGGLLFYQTFACMVNSNCGPSSPTMRLQDNELLNLFRPLHIRVYREEQKLGDISRGWRNLAMLVAEKV